VAILAQDGFGASPPLLACFPFVMSSDADVCHTAAGKLGPIWKRFRKKLPPVVRDQFAELLLELRHFVVPSELLSPAAAIGSSRYDIRGITELLRYVSARDEGRAIENTAIPIYPPPPPPPVLPGLETGIFCSELEAFRQSLFSSETGLVTKIGSIEVDDSVCFELGGCDVQHGRYVPDIEEKLYSTAGLPCVLFDDAAATAVEHTGGDEISNVQGALTCIQPDGSMSDGQVYTGLVEHLEVAAISEPAIGNEEEKDPFDDLPFAAVQAALRSTCHVAYGIGDIVSIGLYNSEYNLQNALVVGIGKQRESTEDIDVHVSVRGSKFWVPARHLEMVTKKPMVSQSNPSLCLVSTLEDNRAFLKRFACSLKRKMPEES